jgi:hypothetical protein
MYTLEENCKERSSIRKIMLASAIIYGLLVIKDTFIISWKIYLRKVENRKNWTSLEYILAYAFLFCACK